MQRRWLFGIGLIILGALSIIPDGDWTFFIFILILGLITIVFGEEEDFE